jgi:hypothetical protein
MSEVAYRTGSRRIGTPEARDARANKLIEEFAKKLRHLAGNESMPTEWRALTARLLAMETLASFMARFMPRGAKSARKRGRPATWAADDKPRRLLNSIESIKRELSEAQFKLVTDRHAIRHWVKQSEPSISDRELKTETEKVAKLLSRARPSHRRRPKKQSQKSRW